jgi:DNA (cytosine-5)-methyltransferase 1
LDHDIAGSRFPANATKRSFDPHSAAKTVTCGGGEYNYHPSGQRRYTNREFASLQTFPLDFQFHNRNTKKQIGNAVPPKLAEVIYRATIESLQETDARELRDEQERRQNPLIIE